jgi:hypothetical protein
MVNDPKKNGSTLMAIGGIAMAMTVAGLFVAFFEAFRPAGQRRPWPKESVLHSCR